MRQAERINPTDLARNHWRYILTEAGIPEKALTGKHTECPACGGKDRFRFDNNDGAGTYYCSGCGAGTGYSLLMKVRDADFPTVLEEVKRLIKPDMPKDQRPKEIGLPEKRASLNRLWGGGRRDADEVIDYLTRRGLRLDTAQRAASVLRLTDKAWHRERRSFERAMLGLVINPEQDPVSVHRTFLFPDGSKERKMMPPVGDTSGAGIGFGDASTDRWLLAEGIETTLAGMEYFFDVKFGLSMINADNLEKAHIPGHVKEVIVVADNDRSFTGQRAAFALANRLAMTQRSLRITVTVPEVTGHDMLDVINSAETAIHYPGGTR